MTITIIGGLAYAALVFLILACCRVSGDADARAEQFERQLPGDRGEQAGVGSNNLIHGVSE